MLCIRELTNLAYASCYVLHYSLYIHFGIQVCLILRPHSPPPLVPGNEATSMQSTCASGRVYAYLIHLSLLWDDEL